MTSLLIVGADLTEQDERRKMLRARRMAEPRALNLVVLCARTKPGFASGLDASRQHTEIRLPASQRKHARSLGFFPVGLARKARASARRAPNDPRATVASGRHRRWRAEKERLCCANVRNNARAHWVDIDIPVARRQSRQIRKKSQGAGQPFRLEHSGFSGLSKRRHALDPIARRVNSIFL